MMKSLWCRLLIVLVLLALIEPSRAASKPVDPKILHIINRLSFGPKPGTVQAVESLGIERYIQSQLSPDSIVEPQVLTNQLQNLTTLSLTPIELLKYVTSYPDKTPIKVKIKLTNQRSKQILDQATQARLLRATHSNRQLQEVMVDFWYNHFNVHNNKGRTRIWVGAYEQQAIRPHALGRFRDLLGATARHPAMLYYLDNFQNRADRRDAQGNIPRLNENYARELMELHTLGVNGGYTQQDVITLARILSGWGIARPDQQVNNNMGFFFSRKRHDFSDKVFLGQEIKGSGEAEGKKALDILARSPATAHHISYKLAQYFVSDRPPTTLVNRLSQRYLATDGNIRELLNTLFQSPEFWDAKYMNGKFKTPYQYVISAVRATGIPVRNVNPMIGVLKQMAMPVYGCPTPDGYKNTEDVWLNPDAMSRRLSFAITLGSGSLPLTGIPTGINSKIPSTRVNVFVDAGKLNNTLGNSLSTKTQQAIASNPAKIQAALILGSPEFMRR